MNSFVCLRVCQIEPVFARLSVRSCICCRLLAHVLACLFACLLVCSRSGLFVRSFVWLFVRSLLCWSGCQFVSMSAFMIARLFVLYVCSIAGSHVRSYLFLCVCSDDHSVARVFDLAFVCVFA